LPDIEVTVCVTAVVKVYVNPAVNFKSLKTFAPDIVEFPVSSTLLNVLLRPAKFPPHLIVDVSLLKVKLEPDNVNAPVVVMIVSPSVKVLAVVPDDVKSANVKS
jgi:hypothetical protein